MAEATVQKANEAVLRSRKCLQIELIEAINVWAIFTPKTGHEIAPLITHIFIARIKIRRIKAV
jgi:hypothetical protein